jgi:hypothetical protein
MKTTPHLCTLLNPLCEISRAEAARIIRLSRRYHWGRAHRITGGMYALGIFTITTR